MSIPSPTRPPDTGIDLDALIQSLPACKRCRDCRRGCDTLLPKCRQCTKAGVECTFFDHGKNKHLPRSYIAELVDHVRKRMDAHAIPSPAASASTPLEPAAYVKTDSVKAESVASEPQSHPVHPEHYFAEAGGSYRYLGAEACLVQSPRQEETFFRWPHDSDDEEWQFSHVQSDATKNHELVDVYLEQVQFMYPVLDLSARYLGPEPPPDLTDAELFELNMVYCIGCHVMPLSSKKTRHPRELWNTSGRQSYHTGHCYKYRCRAAGFFETAECYIEAATADATIEGLRAILLLAINGLFDPNSCNIGQLIALAARLAIALEQTVPELCQEDVQMLRNMHTTVFSLENELATVLDRPATFPEPEGELSFDPSNPADYLCSIYRLQHRFRKGDASARDSALEQLPLLDTRSRLPASLRLRLHQTHLLLKPGCWSAWYVLDAVVAIGSIHVCVTPHWVYRAATVLIKEDMREFHPSDVIQLYSNALLVLELSAWKWGGSASALAGSLTYMMQQMKKNTSGPLWDKPQVLYDVSL